MALAERAIAALATVIAALPDGGERREGQRTMTAAVADAIEAQSHLVVQASTGIGKSQLRSGATAGSLDAEFIFGDTPAEDPGWFTSYGVDRFVDGEAAVTNSGTGG